MYIIYFLNKANFLCCDLGFHTLIEDHRNANKYTLFSASIVNS